MGADPRYLFVSYVRDDIDRVKPIVDAVRDEFARRMLPVELWMDVTHLQPGESWADSITEALEAAIGFLLFVSHRSLQSHWIRQELAAATSSPDRLVFPVVLSGELPEDLARWQALFLNSGLPTEAEVGNAAIAIADGTERYLARASSLPAPVTKEQAPRVAADIARDLHASEPVAPDGRPTSVFVVHGHDDQALAQLEQYLGSVGVKPVILSRRDESPQSLLQKFFTLGSEARFAIVLLCADDYGASRLQYEADGVGERALQFRARQNVILELGFFYGRLGWENVFVVHHAPDRVFPNFERPSDLDGAVFDSLSGADWRTKLNERLVKAGFELTHA